MSETAAPIETPQLLLDHPLKRKRVVLAVLMRGVGVMYPHNVMWIHN